MSSDWIGRSIAHYRITAKLGEGGMGEVWRARDTKLERDVAVKVLPQAFLEDPERLSRFEREAKLLAQLHHPNIASIFGIEEEGGVRALAMELVEGPTLADRLEPGALPVEEALAIARQLAEALEEAHDKGIIHRDLKPQNIKASTEGKVKVLDFGLAKAMDPMASASGGSSELAKSPTLTLGATVHGVILGTAAYMAPEQARGLPVDKRADIWAFGVVLYEMLSGRRLFEGELVSDVLAGVLRQEVDWKALPDSTPPAIRRLLRRCLERQPKNRLHDIADARIVIAEVLAGRSEEATAPPSAAGAAPGRPSPMPLLASGAVALVLGLAIGALLLRPEAHPEAEMRFPLALPAGWHFAESDTPTVAISADGTRRVLAASSDKGERVIFYGELGQVDWRRLPGTEGAEAPFFSPDGKWVGFFAGNEMRRIAVEGGPSLAIAKSGAQTRGAVWLPDGTIVFSPDAAEPLLRVADGGGEVKPLTTLESARNERTHRWPDLLPDGKTVLFTCDTSDTTEFYDDASIEAVSVATGARKVVLRGSSQARYLDPGVLVYARGGTLFAVRFDPVELETRGDSVPVQQSVATIVASGAAQFAVSRTGTLFWIPGMASTFGSMPVWIDRKGQRAPILSDEKEYVQLALSPDGRRLALGTGDAQNNDIWIADLERGARSRLTFQKGVADPTWTPDGKRVAYDAVTEIGTGRQASGIFWKAADGSGDAETLVSGAAASFVGSFSEDGRYLFFERTEPGSSQSHLWYAPLDGDRKPVQLTSGPFSEYQGKISPDGKWLAYISNESGQLEVFVRPFPTSGGKWQISTATGLEPNWSRDGRLLYYRGPGGLTQVAIDTAHGFEAGKPELVAGGFRSGDNPRTYSPAADGQRFAALPAWEVDRSLLQVDLALHWDREVKRQLASKR